MRFDGKVAVVTGGASGIGRAASQILAARGAAVAVLDLADEAGSETVQCIHERDGRAMFRSVNIAKPEQVHAAVEDVREVFGPIDILVVSAGIQRYGNALTTSDEQWAEVFGVNLSGAWYAARACLPDMVGRGGAIVNVASVQSLASQYNVLAYTASKHAVIGLTRSMAMDFAADKVRVNAVCPGTVDTAMLRWAASLDPNPQSVLDACANIHPLGRVARPEEIGEVVAFLAHDRASFVTGAVWTVDGGLLTLIGGTPRTNAQQVRKGKLKSMAPAEDQAAKIQSAATEDSDGLRDHPQAVYTPPPALDQALAALPLVEVGANAPKRIGYLINYSFHIWYQILLDIIARRAAQYGASVIVRDAGLSVERQIEQARELLDQVDALILTPAATEGLEPIIRMGSERGVPVVVEANPVEGMKTLIAICDYDAGYELGQWVGQNIKSASGQPLKVLDMGLPTLRPCLLRSDGFIEGLQSIQPDAAYIARVNGEGSKIIAKRLASRVFAEHRDIDVIFAMDDETGQGAFEAYGEAALDTSRLTLATFGLAGNGEKDLLMAGGPLKVGAAMFPEYVAVRCVDGVMRVHRGDEVNKRDVIPAIPMTAELLPKYYSKIDDAWTPNLEAIAALSAKSNCTRV